MKILFITHCHGNYGASKSLQLLVQNYRDAEVTMIIPKSLKEKNDIKKLREFYGKHIKEIKEFFLPFKYCYMGCPTEWYLKVKNWLKNLIAYRDISKVHAFIEKEKFDIIHLNAPVLYPLISKDHNYTVHMRDVMLPKSKKAFKRLQEAKGIIFIDEGTKDPFQNKKLNHSIVLNNPFDMRSQKDYDSQVILNEYHLSTKSIIISCIGRIKESKGVKFIIESFLKTENPDLKLLIFGNGDSGSNYENECRELAKSDKRIYFMGEEEEINKVYKISDYIVRGDPWHLIGRTVFEGLFADCSIIIPGTEKDIQDNPDLLPFKDKIHIYSARDKESLKAVIGKINDKVNKSQYTSNVDDYIKKFNNFLKEAK